jgi:2-(1,2-epoxy-1,2-dihydrophenyl)acetyl-CoA isomerase
MSNSDILTSIDGGVATITFNRPEARNALTAAMLITMREFLKSVEHDPTVRCVVLTGAGDHFMAGGDVAGFGAALEMDPNERRRDFEARARSGIPIFTTLQRMPQPVIAKVRGAVAGASIGWVAAADYVIASETALFVFAHIHLGASPDGGVTWHVPRAIGLRKAKELVMLGGRLNAHEAANAGLVNQVVADADLDQEAAKIVRRFAEGPSVALAQSKKLLNFAAENSQARQMELEASSFADCAATQDFLEGIAAFTEKRKPAFTGS